MLQLALDDPQPPGLIESPQNPKSQEGSAVAQRGEPSYLRSHSPTNEGPHLHPLSNFCVPEGTGGTTVNKTKIPALVGQA